MVVLALPAHQAFLNWNFDVEALEQEVAAAEAELEAASEATK